VQNLHSALAAKNTAELKDLVQGLPADVQQSLLALPGLYGDLAVLDEAAKVLRPSVLLTRALDDLKRLAHQLQGLSLSFDLADLRGYAYYTGMRFSLFGGTASGALTELVRGGRYDEVGGAFGRKRPAVGFSLDLKELVSAVEAPPLKPAVRAPWGDEPQLRQAVAALRQAGETVVCVLPGHEHEVDEFQCDRVLVARDGVWQLQALAS
jgi:ATP phosphoribosyltransferase regulatory subunit